MIPTEIDFKPDPDLPEKPHVTVHLERGPQEDTIWLSQCVDPQFDMQLLCEGLSTAIVVAAKYTERDPKDVLAEVVHNMTQAVAHHGNIKRKE